MKKKKTSVSDFLWKDKKHRAKNFYFVLTLFIVFAAVILGFVNSKLDMMQTQDDTTTTVPMVQQQTDSTTTAPIVYDEEELKLMKAISEAGSLNDFLYQWSDNGGDLYSSKNVINLLLLGLDSEDALENGGRSDSMILVSLNKRTEQINMISFFRDAWCYTNAGGYDTFNKMNASYYYGGPSGVIDTIEKNYKIDIDYFVAVDFSSFVDIIDALGGLTVEVQQYEAEYINATTRHTIKYGPAVTLTGAQALVFARIRQSDSDSDVSRTRRQRQVITSLINSVKGASITQLNDVLDLLFQYVKTDLSKMQIISYATQALTNGWLNYEIVQHSFLSEKDVYRTGYVGSSSVVIMDFPLAAQRVQTAVYGDSNIVLEEDRQNIFYLVDELDGY